MLFRSRRYRHGGRGSRRGARGHAPVDGAQRAAIHRLRSAPRTGVPEDAALHRLRSAPRTRVPQDAALHRLRSAPRTGVPEDAALHRLRSAPRTGVPEDAALHRLRSPGGRGASPTPAESAQRFGVETLRHSLCATASAAPAAAATTAERGAFRARAAPRSARASLRTARWRAGSGARRRDGPSGVTRARRPRRSSGPHPEPGPLKREGQDRVLSRHEKQGAAPAARERRVGPGRLPPVRARPSLGPMQDRPGRREARSRQARLGSPPGAAPVGRRAPEGRRRPRRAAAPPRTRRTASGAQILRDSRGPGRPKNAESPRKRGLHGRSDRPTLRSRGR